MAPNRKRTPIRARAASAASKTTSAPVTATGSNVRPTKKDKRILKHKTLLNRVQSSGISKSNDTKSRRRPGKKMPATEGLADDLRDALPDVSVSQNEEDEWEGISDDDAAVLGSTGNGIRRRRRRKEGQTKIKMQSLRHRPGVMKRKEDLARREMERFGKNLAQMADPGASKIASDPAHGQTADKQGEKWAALRRFIEGTMEKHEAFRNG